MLSFIRRRMVSKIFLGVSAVLCITFLLVAHFLGKNVENALHNSNQESALQIAGIVRSSIEHSMLSGKGIEVKRHVSELKKSVKNLDTKIKIFDPNGIEVFRKHRHQNEKIDPLAQRVLRENKRMIESNVSFRPIAMEKRCAGSGCHDDSDTMRGALRFTLNRSECEQHQKDILRDIIQDGFIHIMTAQKTADIDNYFDDISNALPFVDSISVVDTEGDWSFGEDFGQAGIEAAVMHQDSEPKPNELNATPLLHSDRCIECHEDTDKKVRGTLLIKYAKELNISSCQSEQLEHAIDISLRYIMTSELGRIIAKFLDGLALRKGIDELVLFDNQGRTYWSTTHNPPPPLIAQSIETQQTQIKFFKDGSESRLRVVEPLHNSTQCAKCHGSELPLRGLVEVDLSTEMASAAKQEAKQIISMTTVLAVLGLLFFLVTVMQILVIKPVHEISVVTESVGRGNFDASVRHADIKGDEVARLGSSINQMVDDLKTKFRLEKFVSKGTLHAAHQPDSLTKGERRKATILFSDIRGFTAYSESVSAEDVVAMLNKVLRAQTDVVVSHRGDVDKFVGDELMVIFEGNDSEVRATYCALAMIEAVASVNETNLSVGIGISTGEVVIGAIGHENRLDFTAIGDVVNTGARLCSAASQNSVLVTKLVEERAAGAAGLEFNPLSPLQLKGKKEALAVFEVKRTKS